MKTLPNIAFKALLTVLSFLIVAVSISTYAGGKKSADAGAVGSDRVWVFAHDGSRSCEKGSGTPLENGQANLKKAGVEVFESKKGTDGMMHIMSCGAATGDQNEYLVKKSDAAAAKKLGFSEKLDLDSKK